MGSHRRFDFVQKSKIFGILRRNMPHNEKYWNSKILLFFMETKPSWIAIMKLLVKTVGILTSICEPRVIDNLFGYSMTPFHLSQDHHTLQILFYRAVSSVEKVWLLPSFFPPLITSRSRLIIIINIIIISFWYYAATFSEFL